MRAEAQGASRPLLLACLLMLLPVSASAQDPTPSYISSMSEFQVRAMSGTFAPTNGKVTMQSVTPSEWINLEGSRLANVIGAWSGGFMAVSGSKLYVHGGGHSDSANNGVYVFDFAGTSAPIGWTLPSISAVAAIRPDVNFYADGRPTSVHTYGGAVYAHHNNHLYRCLGSPYGGGLLFSACYKYNLATGQWSQIANYPSGAGTANIIYDAGSGKFLMGRFHGSNGEVHFYRTSNDTWSAAKTTPAQFGGEGCGCYDPTRSRGLVVGSAGFNRLVTIDWAAETVSSAALSTSGAALPNQKWSCVYDPALDVYWVFGGGGGSPGWTQLYRITAGTLVVTTHPLTGDTITQMSNAEGSYGRFVFMPQWRAIGTIASVDSPAYVIKLPGAISGGTPPPPPPSGDTQAPTVAVTAPSGGTSVTGTVTVTASATDNVGVAGVQFRLDGANLATERTTAPYTLSWNTTTVSNGTHTLSAVARDAAGNTKTAANVTVTVANAAGAPADTQAPTVAVTAPSGGASGTGRVTGAASATDNVGVVGVQFRLDGANLGTERTTAPYTLSWNTTTVSNGTHTLSAVARDAAGNTKTAASGSEEGRE